MKDIDKSKEELLHEIAAMRQQIQAMTAMHESDARFATAFNSSPIPMCITKFPEGRYVSVNDSFITMSGYSRQEVLGQTSTNLNIWVSHDDRLKFIESLRNKRPLYNEEIRFRIKSGEIITTLYSAEYVIIAEKNYVLSSTINITQLKQAQEALQRSEQEFKALAENSPDIVTRFDKSLRFVYINPKIELITEIAAELFIGRTLQEVRFPRGFCDLWTEHLHKVFTTKKKSQIESTFVNSRGQQFYYQARLVPEFGIYGSVEFVLCTIRDITALKKTETALRISEERKQRLLSSIPDLLFQISKNGIFLDYQGSKNDLLYTPPDIFLGKSIREVFPAESAELFMSYVNKALESGQAQVFEYQLPVDGLLCSFEARIVTISEEEVLFIVRDITDLKLLQNEIARLDRLNLVGEMAASIGHEVRNPMTTVRGFLQLLSRKPDFLKFGEFFTLMIEELDRANAIISEFLSLAKNKAVCLEPQNLTTVVKSIAPLIQADATISDKSLHLELSDIPDVLIDAKEIRQLILNLTRNGFEAMPPGSALTIRTFQNGNEVVLAVQDEGHGIEPDILDKLGMPFLTTKETGTGLGLPICYSIATRHNADISIDTGANGTTFFVRFKAIV